MTDNPKCKLAFKVLSLFCLIAIAVCCICNVVISKGFTWAWYPLLAIPFAWAVASPPLLAKKYRIAAALAALTVLITPFLYLLERLTPVNGWFSVLGAPVAVIGIIAVWITYFLVRFVKINRWYLSAALVFLYGVVVSSVANYLADAFLGNNFLSLHNIVNILSCTAITALLCILGRYKNMNEKLRNENAD